MNAIAKKSSLGRKGWQLAIYCLLVYFFLNAGNLTINVLVPMLNETHGWNTTLLYSCSTIASICTMIVYYVLGVLNNKGIINLRTGAIVCGVIQAICITLWGFTNSLWSFMLVCVMNTISGNVWGRFFNDSICANWFPTKKGQVMGITTIGFPVGSAFGVLIFNNLSAITGNYALNYVFYGIASLILAVWGFAAFRPYPEDMGCYPDNNQNMTDVQAKELLEEGKRNLESSIWTPSRLLKTWQVWVLAIGVSVMEFYAVGAIGQMIPNLIEAGYEFNTAKWLMTACCCFAGVSSIFIGMLDQKVGTKKAIMIVMAIGVVGALSRGINSPVTIWTSIISVGILQGGGPNFTVSICSTLWGRYNFKKAFGTVLTISSCCAAFGATVMSAVAEASSYRMGYVVMGCIVLFGFIMMCLIRDDFVRKCEAKYAAKN